MQAKWAFCFFKVAVCLLVVLGFQPKDLVAKEQVFSSSEKIIDAMRRAIASVIFSFVKGSFSCIWMFPKIGVPPNHPF